MEITRKNYFKIVDKIGLSELPGALADAHKTIGNTTKDGSDWSQYDRDPRFKRIVNLAFGKLKEFTEARGSLEGVKPIKDKRYANIQTECMFIDRFLSFHGKVVYKNTFGIFIDDLQKAMDAKRIRKTSPVAKEIMDIQRAAVKQFNTMYNADYFVLKPETIKRFNEIVAKWENSYDDIDEKYARSKKDTIALQGIAQTQPTLPSQPDPAPAIMSSEAFAQTDFKTIGLQSKWLKLIGDPSPGFKAMVFGMPKMGKSYLCVDFASYLSKNHGKVLYISKEEFLSPTLALKLKDKDAANANLDIAGTVPADLSAYQFVFLDSVTSLKLTPDDLKALEQKYPRTSFIYVFQVTKAGSARGTNEYMHNVDVVIEIPERGKAVQFGRFNQGGEMEIFNDDKSTEALVPNALYGLDGKSKEDWTEAKGLMEGDKYYLKQIKKCVEDGDMASAMDWASRGDTEVREAIPGEIWVKMGGTLLKTGWEKLKQRGFTVDEISKLKLQADENENRQYGYMPDDEDLQPEKKVKKPKKVRTVIPLDADSDWTENMALNLAERKILKRFKAYFDEGEMGKASSVLPDDNAEIRAAIPMKVWYAVGGSYKDTPKAVIKKILAARKEGDKFFSSTSDKEKKKKKTGKRIYLPYTQLVVMLDKLYNETMGKNETSIDFCEILADAVEDNERIPELVNEMETNLAEILTSVWRAADRRGVKYE